MIVTVERRSRNAYSLEERIDEIGDYAGQLVARHLRGRLPRVQAFLTNGSGVADLMQRADLAMAGKPSRRRRAVGRLTDHWHARRACAAVTPVPDGVLIAINAGAHRDNPELDRTLIYGLSIAVQLNQPGARDRHIAYLRQQYGIDPHSADDQREYERFMSIRERHASNLEALARQLPGH